MRQNHPDGDAAAMTSIHSADQFKSEMPTADFEAMMTATWHSAYELRRTYESALAQVQSIQQMIAVNLSGTDAE